MKTEIKFSNNLTPNLDFVVLTPVKANPHNGRMKIYMCALILYNPTVHIEQKRKLSSFLLPLDSLQQTSKYMG